VPLKKLTSRLVATDLKARFRVGSGTRQARKLAKQAWRLSAMACTRAGVPGSRAIAPVRGRVSTEGEDIGIRAVAAESGRLLRR